MKRTYSRNVLIMVLQGTLFLSARGVKRAVQKGEYILLKAGEEHFGYKSSEENLLYQWIHFGNEKTFEQKKPDSAARSPLVCGQAKLQNKSPAELPEYSAVLFPERISMLFHQLADISFDEGFCQQMADCAVSLLVLELCRSFTQLHLMQNNVPSSILSAASWIRAHYYEQFDVSFLAQSTKYSVDYFCALFKKNMGESITAYTNRIRLKAAKNLLLSYDMSIKEAAYSCGFEDEKYFMRVFKKTEGMTPSQFKSAFKKTPLN